MRQNLALLLACSTALFAIGCDGETHPPITGPGFIDDTPPQIAPVRPPALSGGTLLVTKNKAVAVAADPDRDRIMLADLVTHELIEVPLELGDEPGRSVEDANGRVHVALRRGGAVVTLDPVTGQILARRPVCSAPRGIAFDATNDAVHVACAGGELARLDASGLSARASVRLLEPDLRDVLVVGDELWISKLRGSEVLIVDASGKIAARHRPGGTFDPAFKMRHQPSTAWRMLALPDGTAALVHQMARSTTIDVSPEEDDDDDFAGGVVGVGSGHGDEGMAMDDMGGGSSSYGGGGMCQEKLVRGELSVVTRDGVTQQHRSFAVSSIGLPVDATLSDNGTTLAVLDGMMGTVSEIELALLSPETGCDSDEGAFRAMAFTNQAIATAYGRDGELLIQTREPASIEVFRDGMLMNSIPLGGVSQADTGYDLFHNIGIFTGSGLACASCHPEGRDDAHVWEFSDTGKRRSQSLAGTLKGTAPFHWAGDLKSLDSLMSEVFVRRMGGVGQSPERVDALGSWLETVEPVRVADGADESSVLRGQALFASSSTGCTSCHSGPAFTNNESMFIGKGLPTQVPSLVGIGARAPFMHDGCAKTLKERFDPSCGGADFHGKTSHLSEQEIDDLVAYMNTL